MDHVAAGEVQRPVVREEAAAPEQEGVNHVHDGDPENRVDAPGLPVDASEHRAQGQDRRDRREHELEVDQRGLRESERRSRAVGTGYGPLALQLVRTEHGPRLADEGVEEPGVGTAEPRLPEAHLERVQDPDHKHDGERQEREHHRVDAPALLHDAAIQHNQAGHAHQADECRRRHLPSGVSLVQPGKCLSWHTSPSSSRGHRPSASDGLIP